MLGGMRVGISENAFIMTPEGYKRVTEIEPGDEIITSSYRKAMVTSVSSGEGKLYLVNGFSSIEFSVSGENCILTRSKANFKERKIRVKDFRMEDYFRPLVGTPVNRFDETIPWNGIDIFDGYYEHHLHNIDTRSCTLWYIAGVFFRSGSFNINYEAYKNQIYRSISFYCNKKKYDAVVASLPSSTKIRYKDVKGDKLVATISDPELAMFLSRFGKKYEERVVPIEVMNLNPELLRAFFLGFMGEHIDDTEFRNLKITTVNGSLLLSFAHLIEKAFGSVARFDSIKDTRGRIINGRRIEMKEYFNMNFATMPRDYPQSLVEDGISWQRIRDIRKNDGTYIELTTDSYEPVLINHMAIG